MSEITVIDNTTGGVAVVLDGPEYWMLPGLINKINVAVQRAENCANTAMQHALTAGAALLEAKKVVPHGQWDDWLRTHCCNVAPRTARAYMSLAKRFPELEAAERQRVANLPMRAAIMAISTSPMAPPRYPATHRPSRDCRERAANALGRAADAQRRLARNIGANFVKRAQVEGVRTKLQAALAALDDLQVDGEVQQ